MFAVYIVLACVFLFLSVQQSRITDRRAIMPTFYRLFYLLTASFVAAAAVYPFFADLARRFTALSVVRWAYRAAWMLLMAMCALTAAYPYLPGVRPDGREKCVIVLGATMLDGRPSLNLLSRADRAAAFVAAHPECDVILSGGRPSGRTEARAMLDRMRERGASAARVHLEERSDNTDTNFVYSRPLMEALGHSAREPVVVLTSGFHCLRACLYARAHGFSSVRCLPARTPITSLPIWLFSDAILTLQYWLLGHN